MRRPERAGAIPENVAIDDHSVRRFWAEQYGPRVATRRFDDRPRTRRPGAGRPRKAARSGDGPVDDEILGAAAHLFARQGVAATTMAQIAEAVGLGVSSIYYYFANKHQLLERIVVDVNQTPLAVAELASASFPDAPHRLHAFVRHDAAALCEFPFDINEVHRLAAEDRSTFERYWADRRRLVAAVQEFVEQGIADGVFVDIDPSMAAVTVLANDEAVQNWYRPATTRPATERAPSTSPAQIGLFVADLALRGLLVDSTCLDAVRTATVAMARPVSEAPDS